MQEYATREELNGHGKSLTGFREDVAGWKGTHETKIENLEKEMDELTSPDGQIAKLFTGQTELKVSVASSRNRVIGAVAVIVLVIQLAFSMAPTVLKAMRGPETVQAKPATTEAP